MKSPQSIQINIPQPCHEDWNKMTPQEQGRFCDSCRKCVVDFTGFSDEELYNYMLAHRGEKVCGHFATWQLKRKVDPPIKLSQKFYKWFIGLGIVIFLSELLSTTAKAQTPTAIEATTDSVDKNKATVTGSVTEPGELPVYYATVILIHNGREVSRTYTDRQGNYTLNNIYPGRYTLVADKTGYKYQMIKNIDVAAGNSYEQNLALKQDSIAVVITEYAMPITGDSCGMTMTGSAEVEMMRPIQPHAIESVRKEETER